MTMTEQRQQFVHDALRGMWTMTELCARYGIARKTGYKWVARFEATGAAGLQERSRRPGAHPTAVAPALAEAVLALRRQHPRWGPRKLRAILVARDATVVWPARSTIAKLLRRAGLSASPSRRRRARAPVTRRLVALAPNHIWTADYKGHFRTGDTHVCYPLTVLDRFSRYALECHALPEPTTAGTRARFERVFATYGLPEVLRTDNGTPFAGTGLAGLSQLAVWWMRLGIQLERITPAHPEENGAHERFHRTLKADTACPPAATLRAQQRRFRAHRREYNEERPHEALGDVAPVTIYRPSARRLPRRLPTLEYPGYYEVRRVGSNGGLHWASRFVFVSTALCEQDLGFEPIDDGLWAVYLAAQPIARFDERTRRMTTTWATQPAPSAGPATGEGPAPGA
jgi:transposase InsO family protein